ncbi:hypothetical protein [Ectopseudomonas alcaliphila]|uniref:hypothetical protein n=1 Tax=Ectopseudomonas alcaliphila TaxID=101564 RepID=UPI00278579E3|nr:MULTISPECIES: hypothetical protein [Pseudomonas]MDP9942533.1 hypothetical protein [Pseudomonas sp. 3400]MDR7014088.1 hypothetical protein [Pseudomonas alcaliphila]
MTRNGLLLLALVLLTGCAAPNKFQSYEYKKGLDYPYVSLLVNDGQVHQSMSCGQYGCHTYTDQTHLFMLNNLRESGKFERVDINNGLAQNKLLVSFQRESAGNAGLDFGKVMFGALTLFLVPISYDYRYQAKFTLLDGSELVKEYEYRRDSEEMMFLFIEPQSAKNNAIKSIVDNLLQDIERDGALQRKAAVANTAQ